MGENKQGGSVEDSLLEMMRGDPVLKRIEAERGRYLDKEAERIKGVERRYQDKMQEVRGIGAQIAVLKSAQGRKKKSAKKFLRDGRKIRRQRLLRLDRRRRDRIKALRSKAVDRRLREQRIFVIREADLRKEAFRRETKSILKRTSAGGRPKKPKVEVSEHETDEA